MVSVISIFGVFRNFKNYCPPFPQIVLLSLAAFLIVSFFRSGQFRKWVESLPLGKLVSIHLVRFVGFYFLFLYSVGNLPYDFAVPGGMGDIIIAVSALYIILNSYAVTKGRTYIILIWNFFGLVDILFVVITAARLMLKDFHSMSRLTELPLSLLITFFVPLIIFSHLVIFYNINKYRHTKIYE